MEMKMEVRKLIHIYRTPISKVCFDMTFDIGIHIIKATTFFSHRGDRDC